MPSFMCLFNSLPEPDATGIWYPWITDSVHGSRVISTQGQLWEKFGCESSDGVGGWFLSLSAFPEITVLSWTRTSCLFLTSAYFWSGVKNLIQAKWSCTLRRKLFHLLLFESAALTMFLFKAYSEDKSETFYQYLHQKLNRLFSYLFNFHFFPSHSNSTLMLERVEARWVEVKNRG